MGTPPSDVAQIVLPIVLVAVLLAAWWREENRRPLARFVADNSKSAAAAACTHLLASGAALLLGKMASSADPCDWYIVFFVWDTFVGVALTIVIHQHTADLAGRCAALEPLSRIGDYEAAPDPSSGLRPPSSDHDRAMRWLGQVAHWVLCAAVARVVDFGILYLAAGRLERTANLIGWWACSHAQVSAKVWLHVVAIPLVLDAAQFLVQNHVLDARFTQRRRGREVQEASGAHVQSQD